MTCEEKRAAGALRCSDLISDAWACARRGRLLGAHKAATAQIGRQACSGSVAPVRRARATQKPPRPSQRQSVCGSRRAAPPAPGPRSAPPRAASSCPPSRSVEWCAPLLIIATRSIPALPLPCLVFRSPPSARSMLSVLRTARTAHLRTRNCPRLLIPYPWLRRPQLSFFSPRPPPASHLPSLPSRAQATPSPAATETPGASAAPDISVEKSWWTQLPAEVRYVPGKVRAPRS